MTDEATIEAARTAAAIMAMTNVYYRAVHMADEPELSQLPAGLRMNGLTLHGIDQADFELFGLAASVVKGCEGCAKAHVAGARKHGASMQAVQATIRIAAVIQAAATVLDATADSVHSMPLPLTEVEQEQAAAGDVMAAQSGGAVARLSPLVDSAPIELDGKTGWLAQWVAILAWSAMLPRQTRKPKPDCGPPLPDEGGTTRLVISGQIPSNERNLECSR
ncbi:carboxymuconolactone decarboxylase family protein [Brucella intermedia]|uniref:carboxymuconolactone decarboxylase family protein n=2 Tax=Brucella intermedia TaxID=94625 RepID=UPI00224AB6DF|nr:carboxymuconolactone decarboxylase family protein [Brucella intermedia]